MLRNTVGSKILASSSLLKGGLEDALSSAAAESEEEASFLKERVQNLRKFHKKAENVWKSPLVRMLLK